MLNVQTVHTNVHSLATSLTLSEETKTSLSFLRFQTEPNIAKQGRENYQRPS